MDKACTWSPPPPPPPPPTPAKSASACSATPCENGGACKDVPSAVGFVCTCADGFSGALCSDEEWPIMGIPGEGFLAGVGLVISAIAAIFKRKSDADKDGDAVEMDEKV